MVVVSAPCPLRRSILASCAIPAGEIKLSGCSLLLDFFSFLFFVCVCNGFCAARRQCAGYLYGMEEVEISDWSYDGAYPSCILEQFEAYSSDLVIF